MKMTNDLQVVLDALQYLNDFSDEVEYKEKCTIIYTYLTDLVEMVKQSQDVAKQAAENYLQAVGLVNNREGRRRLRKAGFTVMPDNEKTE